jgi:PP-loop superfamily ATP-utilizing enzyme
MDEMKISINNNNSCLVVKNVITQQILSEKYNVTINCVIETTGFSNIELYYYWTLDKNLNILDTSYIRYHIKGNHLDWNNIDEILSNLAIGNLYDKILNDKFNNMSI